MPPKRTSNVQVRPAHTSGPTFLCYSPNGRKLITVGSNNTIRVFETGSSSEPVNIDDSQDSNTAVVASNDFFITGSEDGSVCKYSLKTQSLEEILTRCTLPIRDLALSPDAQWVAAASEELVVKVINTNDSTRVLFLREQAKPSKHLSFDQSGSFLAITCVEGSIYVYSMQSGEPELVKKIDGVTKMLGVDQQASSTIAWHPDDEVFATPSRHRGICIVSKNDWVNRTAFDDGHISEITAMAWSPNGGFFVTSTSDMTICLWDSTTQNLIYRIEDLRTSIWAFAWHPTENILAYTNNDGELNIHSGFVPPTHLRILDESLVPYTPKKNALNEISGEVRLVAQRTNKTNKIHDLSSGQTTDFINDIARFDELSEYDDDDLFVEDYNGVGYAERTNENGKRSLNPHDENCRTDSKRRMTNNAGRALVHPNFQPGSTPWRGNRRYLCLNLVGSLWVIKQGEYHIVTVEFNDHEVHRDFHFTESVEYDKACLNEKGILLSSTSLGSIPATIFYRPHKTWTTRSEWRMNFRKGEDVTAIALSESFIVITTTKNYIRVYTLFGTPIRLYRHKSCPLVTCVAWREYVLTVANGPILANGMPGLVYSIISLRQDKICQDEDTIALRENSTLYNVFFSDSGDPCIYDSDGVLLILEHWRVPGQARWVPLLDMNELHRVADGRKEESYWPLGVAQNKFYCIILKGVERYPYFPRPLLSEFDFKIPLASIKIHTTSETDSEKLEETYVRTSVLHSLQKDLISSTNATQAQKVDLGQKALEIDKLLLQLLAVECVESEEQGMKALELVNLMRDRSGRMLEAAGKIATRFGRHVLREKIQELAERRLIGQGDSSDAE